MKRRYLYVDVNATFTNPTRNLLPLALLKAADIRFFGPGHVTSERLARGLRPSRRQLEIRRHCQECLGDEATPQ